MDREEAQARIREINNEHESDHDGGYALVDALKQAREDIDFESRGVFAEALGDLVRSKDQQLWAVALEALVQLGEGQEVVSLGEELALSPRDEKWKDNVVLALLRLGKGQFLDTILEHVRASLENPRTLTVPIVAALCRIDRDACLEISSTYFGNAYTSGRSRHVEGFISAFVRNFVAVDEQLLSQLVQRVAIQRPEAGQWLSRLFSDYLSKPWMLQEIGSTRSASTCAGIAMASGVSN